MIPSGGVKEQAVRELKAAIDANDLARVQALLTQDPALHRAQDAVCERPEDSVFGVESSAVISALLELTTAISGPPYAQVMRTTLPSSMRVAPTVQEA